MIELKDIESVSASIAEFIEKGDYTSPFIIGATTLEKDGIVADLIDQFMKTNRVGVFVSVDDLKKLGETIKKAEIAGSKYIVKKVYNHENLDNSSFDALTCKYQSSIPSFVIVCAGNLSRHSHQLPANSFLF